MSGSDSDKLELFHLQQDELINKRAAECQSRQEREPRFSDWDRNTCYDCGNDMPIERLNLGRVRCVDCQAYAEIKGDD